MPGSQNLIWSVVSSVTPSRAQRNLHVRVRVGVVQSKKKKIKGEEGREVVRIRGTARKREDREKERGRERKNIEIIAKQEQGRIRGQEENRKVLIYLTFCINATPHCCC